LYSSRRLIKEDELPTKDEGGKSDAREAQIKIFKLEDNLEYFKNQIMSERHESFMLKLKLGLLTRFTKALPANDAKLENEMGFSCQLCGKRTNLALGYMKCSYDKYKSFCIPIPKSNERPIITFAGDRSIDHHHQSRDSEYIDSQDGEATEQIIRPSFKPSQHDNSAMASFSREKSVHDTSNDFTMPILAMETDEIEFKG